jgi:DNA polymerase-3 subunit epsilon
VTLDPRAPWWSYPLIVVDFETSGIDPAACGPVSVAAVRLEQGKELGHFYSLVRPGCPISAEASAVHGITDEQVADAPELVDVAPYLAGLAHDALPCAYNGTIFDKIIWHRYLSNAAPHPLFDPAQPWLDPLVMVRKIDRYARGTGRHRLAATCERWGVPFAEGEAHNALADVRAVGRLLAALVAQGKVRPHVSLGRMIAYAEQVRAEQDQQWAAYQAKLKAREAQQTLPLADGGEPKEGTCQTIDP